MTMLDEDRLASLFAQAGATFEVPAAGVADVLERASRTGGGDTPDAGAVPEARPPGRVRRAGAAAGRHRVLTVAAAVVVLLLGAGALGALVRTTPAPTVRSSLSPSTGSLPLVHPPATTVPRGLPTTSVPRYGTEAPRSSVGAGGAPAVTTPTTPVTPTLPSGVGQPAKIQQTGSLALTVRRGGLARAMTALTALAGANGGFVASSQTQSGAGAGGTPSGSIMLQVPVASFSSVLAQAEALGRPSGVTTKATDVTGQYVDLQQRIAALEASRQQYLTIMTKATSIGDVLSVQEQLDGIDSQIEQLQGQLQVLTSETSYSTLAVTVGEAAPPPRPGPRPESGLARAWHDSVSGFVAGVEGVVRLAGPVLFALLCLALVVVGGRALWRRYQRHNL